MLDGTVDGTPPARLSIAQVSRSFEPGKGVSNVALFLEAEFARLGHNCARVSLETLRIEGLCRWIRSVNDRIGEFFEIVLFSVLAPIAVTARRRRGWLVISHNDCIVGDVFVNHGLIKPLFRDKPKWRPVLPVHAFLLAREELRYRLNRHLVVVNFSRAGEAEHHAYYNLRFPMTSVIPNGVDLETFRTALPQRASQRRELGLTDTDLVCLFVGNEFGRKGLDLVLKAMADLPSDVQLVVAGGSEEMVSSARGSVAVGDRAKFLGQVPYDQVPRLCAAADVFVLPTAHEASPLVLLEAMAAGVVCVTTDVSSIKDVVRDGDNGLIVARTADNVRDAIRYLKDHPAARQVMAQQATRAVSSLSWEQIAKRYVELLMDVARMRRPAPELAHVA